jgi:hypothetical protein
VFTVTGGIVKTNGPVVVVDVVDVLLVVGVELVVSVATMLSGAHRDDVFPIRVIRVRRVSCGRVRKHAIRLHAPSCGDGSTQHAAALERRRVNVADGRRGACKRDAREDGRR